jgi:1-acyl-sn-glycerol-3-phosphate acyltransferase
MIYVIGKFLFFSVFRLFFHFRVFGRENIPRRGGFLLACNHVSYLDPIVFGCACPRFLSFMARDTLFKARFFGWLLMRVRAFPLKRNAADLGAIKEALRRLKRQEGLLLFPEGTRTVGGKIGRGHAGVGFLARKSGVPVVPAFVRGTDIALSKTDKRLRRAPITVWFGEPLMLSAGSQESDEAFAGRVMERISALKAAADVSAQTF